MSKEVNEQRTEPGFCLPDYTVGNGNMFSHSSGKNGLVSGLDHSKNSQIQNFTAKCIVLGKKRNMSSHSSGKNLLGPDLPLG